MAEPEANVTVTSGARLERERRAPSRPASRTRLTAGTAGPDRAAERAAERDAERNADSASERTTETRVHDHSRLRQTAEFTVDGTTVRYERSACAGPSGFWVEQHALELEDQRSAEPRRRHSPVPQTPRLELDGAVAEARFEGRASLSYRGRELAVFDALRPPRERLTLRALLRRGLDLARGAGVTAPLEET